MIRAVNGKKKMTKCCKSSSYVYSFLESELKKV